MPSDATDRQILRDLASQYAEIAALPIHAERRAMWQRLNRLDPVKPMVNISQVPWHEMNVDDELTLRTEDPFHRRIEWELRRTLYEWRHMPVDMFLAPLLVCPLVIQDTGFGIREDVDIVKTDERNSVVSRHFHRQISSLDDLLKIQMPTVTYDAQATETNRQRMRALFDGILPVEAHGPSSFWFAPWDELIRWYTVEAAMEDLLLTPDLVHAAMDRLVSAYLHRLDQYEAQNLLSLGRDGGTFATDELPRPGYDPDYIRPRDLWSIGAAQIFSDVSPRMHWEFALQYEVRWFKRWGLNYYGCCEPLHHKVEVVSRIPNLRKISMSPWVDQEVGAEAIAGRYVYSRKPNPAMVAVDRWDPEYARQDLIDTIEITRRHGCPVEFLLKDISTVRYQPQRLWEWARIAAEVTADYA